MKETAKMIQIMIRTSMERCDSGYWKVSNGADIARMNSIRRCHYPSNVLATCISTWLRVRSNACRTLRKGRTRNADLNVVLARQASCAVICTRIKLS